jgi:hypothetical protein
MTVGSSDIFADLEKVGLSSAGYYWLHKSAHPGRPADSDKILTEMQNWRGIERWEIKPIRYLKTTVNRPNGGARRAAAPRHGGLLR